MARKKIPDKAKTSAAIEKTATDSPEERAAIIKKMLAADSPEKRAAIEKMKKMADSPETRAAREARKTIGRYIAVRDGQIPPPWAEKLVSGGARLDQDDKEPLLPIDCATVVLRYLYRTKAQMPRSLKEATTAVVEECKKRVWRPVDSPDTVHRAAVKLGYRAPRKRRSPRKR
jgi:hypothetical protein